MNGLALCAGVGGLELGLRLAIGDAYRTVGYVERYAYAAAALVARMEDQALDHAVVWNDLTAFDGRPWRGSVDLVSGGYPCQPFSYAGSRKGADDERHLWPHVARILEQVRPPLAFFENVAGHVSLGLPDVLGDLAALGFDAEWGLFRAADFGAGHRRERLFILAYRDGGGLGWNAEQDQRKAARQPASRRGDADGRHLGFSAPFPPGPAGDWSGIDQRLWPAVGNAKGHGLQGRTARPNEGRREGEAVNGPGSDQQGREPSGTQPSLRGVADGLAPRVERLRALGNGVVPVVAGYAFVTLARRAGVLT